MPPTPGRLSACPRDESWLPYYFTSLFAQCSVKEVKKNKELLTVKHVTSLLSLKPLTFLFLCYRQIIHHLGWGVMKPPPNVSLEEW